MNHLKLFIVFSILVAYVLALPGGKSSNGLITGQISYSHFGDAAACQLVIPNYETGLYVGVNNGIKLCGRTVRVFDASGHPHDATVIDSTSSGDDSKMIGSAKLFNDLGFSEKVGTIYNIKFGLCDTDIKCPKIHNESV